MPEIVIIDNHGQYVHRIWRSFRELGIESEIAPSTISVEELESKEPIALVLSGGPYSVYKDELKGLDEIVSLAYPMLGICLGHQYLASYFGGRVEHGEKGEYGFGEIIVDEEDVLFKGIEKTKFQAWVSHRDEVIEMPKDFKRLAHSDICKFEAVKHKKQPIFGVQFHPEVSHTENGMQILKNFVDDVRRDNNQNG